jgi:hypothetical protein
MFNLTPKSVTLALTLTATICVALLAPVSGAMAGHRGTANHEVVTVPRHPWHSFCVDHPRACMQRR